MRKCVSVVLGLALLAGCEAAAPTSSAEVEGPSLDGGVMFGSGHSSGSDSTSQNSTATQENGGGMFGSGH